MAANGADGEGELLRDLLVDHAFGEVLEHHSTRAPRGR
jgi:hypothetical protein